MNVRVVETHIHRTPFGVQCLDSATRQVVRTGLTLRLRPPDSDSRTVPAFLSASGVFGFERVPGLFEEVPGQPERAWEYDESVTFPAGKTFTLLCEDNQGRFLPCSQTLNQSHVQEILPLPLFAAPARPAASGMCVVRGRIVQKVGADRTPAAYVKIEAQYPATAPVFTGLSDERGEFALFLPSPDPKATASNPAAPLHEKTWPVTLTFFYQPAAQKFACLHREGQMESVTGLASSDLLARRASGWQCFPDMTALLGQQTADVFRAAADAAPASSLQALVPLGRAAIALTTDSPDKCVWLSS